MIDLCADACSPAKGTAAPAVSAAPRARVANPRSGRAPGGDDAVIADWRGFHDALRHAALAATQSGAPLSLLLVEVAGVGRGRRAAEAARRRIQALAGTIAAEAGKGSALARYAEERLAVLMLETGLGDAVVRAERIGCSLCSGRAGALYRPAIGVAQFRDDEALGHLIERAEDALDRARAGGALVVIAGDRARSAGRRTSQMAI